MANSEGLDAVLLKLQDIIARLERIEQRQVKTTALVEDVKVHEAPVVGSFGSINHGEEQN